MNISVERAVNLIDATIQLHKEDQILPYFFIVGAGISAPEIPLASGIVELCKKEIRTRNPEYFDQCKEEMDNCTYSASQSYSGWIERAYPNSVDRSRFFKSIIKNSKMSSGNLMLANVLYSRRIATTVFTTNFDDKLKQALELIGVTELFVAENAMDNLVISPNNVDIQVIHVHGTYNFYDCANLDNEIRTVANQNNTISSSRVLSSFLMAQAPIIVGYSGWENDVIMTCLKERLSYPTPLTYIWVCYSKESYEALPEWLKKSTSVAFVIPDMDETNCEDGTDGIQYVQKDIMRKGRIDATTFFRMLISSMKLGIPEIFANPFSYYSKRIEQVLPQHEDVLHLRHWANRMKYYGAADSEFENLVKQLEHADVANDMETAIKVLGEITGIELGSEDVCFTSESLVKGLLEKEDVFANFEEKLRLRSTVLDYIEANIETLQNADILNSSLLDVFVWPRKREDRIAYIPLLDRICEIAKKKESTLEPLLTAMGVKSAIIEDEKERISILEEIVALSGEYLDDPSIRYAYCIAQYDLAEILPLEPARKILKTADAQIKEDERAILHVKALKAKAAVLLKLENEEEQIKWVKYIIRSVEKNSECFEVYDVRRITNDLLSLPNRLLKQIEELKGFLIGLYEKYTQNLTDGCEFAHWLTDIALTLSDISDNAIEKASYYTQIKNHLSKMPISCESRQVFHRFALGILCSIPIIIVPDNKKIQEIVEYKKYYPEDKTVVIQMVITAQEIGNSAAYENCGDLDYEVGYSSKTDTLRNAYDCYLLKDFEQAELGFLSLLECGYSDIEEQARINLAFMIRRNETRITKHSFWEIIGSVSDERVFKSMNTVLYCIHFGQTDHECYSIALANLKNISPEEVNDLRECWNNVDMVGEEESALALSIIERHEENDYDDIQREVS